MNKKQKKQREEIIKSYEPMILIFESITGLSFIDRFVLGFFTSFFPRYSLRKIREGINDRISKEIRELEED